MAAKPKDRAGSRGTARRVHLVHGDAVEAQRRVDRLRSAGYVVTVGPAQRSALAGLRQDPPAAVIIDLGLLPSHGRHLALALRDGQATRGVPLVFVAGTAEMVSALRALLPDAAFATWPRIEAAVRKAMARPPPAVPAPQTQSGPGGTPLLRALGIRAGSQVALISAPAGFESTFGLLPRGAALRRDARGRPDLVIWFAKSCAEMEKRIRALGALAGISGLWIAWPKKGSGVKTDLTQAAVRKIGLAAGLVDYKGCAFDTTWSGLRFTRRGEKPAAGYATGRERGSPKTRGARRKQP